MPKAIIHRKILDAAATDPEASHEELASTVSGASPGLVERVLETYGDPADEVETATAPIVTDGSRTASPETTMPPTETTHTETDDADSATSEGESLSELTDLTSSSAEIVDKNGDAATLEAETAASNPSDSDPSSIEGAGEPQAETSDEDPIEESSSELPSLDELTDKQRQTLRAIAANPTATQAELAAEFDVTPATISAHVNAVDGFEWNDRTTFVAELFDEQPTKDDPDTIATERNQTMPQQYADDRFDQIETQLTEITERLERTESGATGSLDSELVHKVVHACMESEQITSDEELQIIQSMLE